MTTHEHHLSTDYSRAFKLGIVLNMGFIAVEVFFGLTAGSLALLADAGHNMSDVLGLFLAWGAAYLTQMEATERRTYGWRKSSILAALFNAIILFVAVGGIGWEALRRLGHPSRIQGATIIWVAAVGVVINGITALLFLSGRKRDLNIKGAFLHMAADAGVSAGVALAGFCILMTGWLWLDPVISLVIVVIILIGTWGLLRDSLNLSLDAVPAHIDTQQVRSHISNLSGVVSIHDLHIWAMSTTDVALTAHVVKEDSSDPDALVRRIEKDLRERFEINHVTIQWESACFEDPGKSWRCQIPSPSGTSENDPSKGPVE